MFGGLGIWKARKTNISMLDKLVWGLHQDCDSIWVQVLKPILEKSTFNIGHEMHLTSAIEAR